MSKQERHLYEFGPYRLVPSERLLLRAGEPVALTPKAFDTLVALVRRAGHLADKDELLTEVWPDSFVQESNLAQNVFALRRALGEEKGKPYIETVPKRGYRFLGRVRIVSDTADELSIEQHLSARSSAPQVYSPNEALAPGFVPTEETVGGPLVITEPATVKQPQERPHSLQAPAAPDITGKSEHETRNAAIILGVIAMAIGGSALLYRFARRANPPSSFQTMKMGRLTTIGKVFDAAISPDGKNVVYAISDGGRQSLWMRQTATQSQVQIIAPAEHVFTGLNFSPDGNYIYYSVLSRDSRQRALFQVETLGGAPKKLLENLRAEALSFSPDGRQFAFVRYTPGKESTLIIANADGTAERILLTSNQPGLIHYPAWSPDGKRIAYGVMNTESNDSTIFEAQVADGSTKPLTARRWFRIVGLSWVSDGSGLMMLATPDQSFVYQLWQLPYPEGEAQRLTNDLNSYTHVSLTADSGTLAVVQSERQSNIWVAPVGDMSRARPVTSGPGKSDNCASWAPDGRIVYQSNAGGADNIWITNADGSNPQQLTSNARINQCPAVSPDGRYIVFQSDRTGIPHIWRMNIDGGDQRQLTNGGGGAQNPQYSPDGRWIVYRTALGGRPTVWKMRADGGDPVQLTGELSLAPTVSPDSTLVAYTYAVENSPGIAVAPLEGGEPLKRFAAPRTLVRPLRWTPDGRAIAYIDNKDGVTNVFAQPLDGGNRVQLTNFTSDSLFSFAFSPDGKQLALARGATNNDVVLIKDFR
jgi:Tol biopolymer transport system component/DNA-binding winged helix-turn-helix (wHTH) protein